MSFFQIYFNALLLVICMMIMIWLLRIRIKNAGIVDVYLGVGFVAVSVFYYLNSDGFYDTSVFITALVAIRGISLSMGIAVRNHGKGEDFRYQKFRNFYRFYPGIYVLLFVVYFGFDAGAQSKNSEKMNKVVVGSQIPGFTLPDQNGKPFDVKSVIGKKKLVIYFYPKDDSPGCTKEACSFRDQFEVFEDAGAIIIGISGQSVESHLEFALKYHLNYKLLSDEGNHVRKLFGVPTNLFGLLPGRVTYVTDSSGKVVYMFNSQINATKHVDEALRVLKETK